MYLPQATTDPSDLIPRLWTVPAAMAMKSALGAGTVHSPAPLPPQATTLPSDLRPRLCPPPPSTATKSWSSDCSTTTMLPQPTMLPES